MVVDFKEVMQLYYYPLDHIFVDDGGFPVFNIFNMITPNELFLFRHCKEYMIVQHCRNPEVGVELIWPDDDEMDAYDGFL